METFTWIASLSINMTPWWFSKWIYFFYLDIFWVCLCALFCLLWFVCLLLYSAKNQHSIGSKWVCNKGQRKGKATLVCWASVYYYASSSWYRGKQFTVIFLIFLLSAPESLLYCFMYHTSHTLLSSLFSHAYVRRYNLVFEINWKANI